MNEPYGEVAYGHARLPRYPGILGISSYCPMSVFPCPALPAWPACWPVVAWEPESVQASPCQACPTFPKGKGPEGQLRGGEGPIGPKVSRPLPQLFEFPRPIPPWTSTNKKKHRQSRPFRRTAPPFKESMRDEIRRAAGTCTLCDNNGRTFHTSSPALWADLSACLPASDTTHHFVQD